MDRQTITSFNRAETTLIIYGPQSLGAADVNMEYVYERFYHRHHQILAYSLVLLLEDEGREVNRGQTRLWIKRRQEKGKGCPYFSRRPER